MSLFVCLFQDQKNIRFLRVKLIDVFFTPDHDRCFFPNPTSLTLRFSTSFFEPVRFFLTASSANKVILSWEFDQSGIYLLEIQRIKYFRNIVLWANHKVFDLISTKQRLSTLDYWSICYFFSALSTQQDAGEYFAFG